MSCDTVLSFTIIVFPKIPESKPKTVTEIDIKKIHTIIPKMRNINLKKLYFSNTTILDIKTIDMGINQDASPKKTNNKALRLDPKTPKAFKGGSSLTVNIEGSNSLYVPKETATVKAKDKQKKQIKVLYAVILKLIFFIFENILIVLQSY